MIPRLYEVFIITIFDYLANSEYISLDLDVRISPLLVIVIFIPILSCSQTTKRSRVKVPRRK